MTVHPRACGERGLSGLSGSGKTGSSPRLRGTAERVRAGATGHRFIPAPAGNGPLSSVQQNRTSVHPRACGERHHPADCGWRRGGSSPRLRGTGRRISREPACGRFIPAPAGNGVVDYLTLVGDAVHPRACGERSVDIEKGLWNCGSSPRLRGTAETWRPRRFSGRFIPAPAGNGSIRARSTRQTTVHPRACGERSRLRFRPCLLSGSSPRLRGTVNDRPFSVYEHRFIPAPAGNGHGVQGHLPQTPVHPRACGERGKRNRFIEWFSGSSPRLRGTAQGREESPP